MVYGHHFPWEAEVQMAASPRTDPIEHQATFDWLKRSDALIVKTYVICASTTWFVVPLGDVLSATDESKIR